jgi:hypothetical protein
MMFENPTENGDSLPDILSLLSHKIIEFIFSNRDGIYLT